MSAAAAVRIDLANGAVIPCIAAGTRKTIVVAAVGAPFPIDGESAGLAVPAATDAIAPLFVVQAKPLAAVLAVVKT